MGWFEQAQAASEAFHAAMHEDTEAVFTALDKLPANPKTWFAAAASWASIITETSGGGGHFQVVVSPVGTPPPDWFPEDGDMAVLNAGKVKDIGEVLWGQPGVDEGDEMQSVGAFIAGVGNKDIHGLALLWDTMTPDQHIRLALAVLSVAAHVVRAMEERNPGS